MILLIICILVAMAVLIKIGMNIVSIVGMILIYLLIKKTFKL